MTSQILAVRSQILQKELQNAKSNVMLASEQLEQSKAHLHMVSGHVNEIAYLLGEEMNLSPVSQEPQSELVNELQESAKELNDGEVKCEEQEQTA